MKKLIKTWQFSQNQHANCMVSLSVEQYHCKSTITKAKRLESMPAHPKYEYLPHKAQYITDSYSYCLEAYHPQTVPHHTCLIRSTINTHLCQYLY